MSPLANGSCYSRHKIFDLAVKKVIDFVETVERLSQPVGVPLVSNGAVASWYNKSLLVDNGVMQYPRGDAAMIITFDALEERLEESCYFGFDVFRIVGNIEPG